MRRLLTYSIAAALAVLGPNSTRAELDASEYVSQMPALNAQERERLAQQIAAERAAEQTREAAREAERQAAAAAEAAERLARLTPEERLLHDRCLRCHDAALFERVFHTRPFWYLVIARMRWVNGAEVTGKEAHQLAGYLAGRLAPDPEKAKTR